MEPREVNIRIRNGNRLIFHCHHEHVRIGKTDIVLDDQFVPAPGCDCCKARVTEFEGGRAVDPGHEGTHHPAVGSVRRYPSAPSISSFASCACRALMALWRSITSWWRLSVPSPRSVIVMALMRLPGTGSSPDEAREVRRRAKRSSNVFAPAGSCEARGAIISSTAVDISLKTEAASGIAYPVCPALVAPPTTVSKSGSVIPTDSRSALRFEWLWPGLSAWLLAAWRRVKKYLILSFALSAALTRAGRSSSSSPSS